MVRRRFSVSTQHLYSNGARTARRRFSFTAGSCFLTIDENGQRLFVLTTSGLSIVQLSNVPLGIGTLSPASGVASGSVSVTVRGSGFVSGRKATLGGKSATVSWKDMNTLVLTTSATSPGGQRLVLTNPDGENVSPDAAFVAL